MKAPNLNVDHNKIRQLPAGQDIFATPSGSVGTNPANLRAMGRKISKLEKDAAMYEAACVALDAWRYVDYLLTQGGADATEEIILKARADAHALTAAAMKGRR